MARIDGEIVIGQPAEVVFDFVADQRNEPTYNPAMTRLQKLTGGPIGVGTRFQATTTSRGRPVDLLIEYTAYDRPTTLGSTIRMATADIRGTLTFHPDPDGTRMRWAWQVTPKGALRLLAPVIARVGRRQEQAIWAGLKQHLEASDGRDRGVERRAFPSSRRLVTAAVRAGRRIVPMHGLLEVDITEARRLLARLDPPLSLTAFVLACAARAAATHPQVHAYRDWRGRLVQHRHVDVQTLIEVPTAQGPFGLVHVVRDADVRTVADISAELRAVKADAAATTTGRLLRTVAPAAGRIPGLYRAMYAAMSRSVRVHLATGTVQVTAVGMFAGGGGFAIAPPTLASLTIVVGGASTRPRAVDGRIELRDVLDLTVTIDHNVVDGAPATRFGADLRRLMETAAVLAPTVQQAPTGHAPT
jgi:polyketide cyclase/dehydrase/lipid transport protein/2-oxoacid dehydrogenase/acyltransferase catalytic subunit